MKKETLLAFVLMLLTMNSFGQGYWAWMRGDTTSNSYNGNLGSSGPNYEPASRYAAVAWYDKADGLWMHGGQGGLGMWKYSISNDEWAWVEYNSTGTVYGIQGVSSPAVHPGNVSFGTPHWVGDTNFLWMLHPTAGDMFRFDIAQDDWTWMNGPGTGNNATPVYGTQGVPADSVNPGEVVLSYEVNNQWVDSDGNFWLFHGKYGTMWKYAPDINQWAWMLGIQAPPLFVQPYYTTIGEFDPAGENTPGSITSFVAEDLLTWQDSEHHFWLFRRRPDVDRIELWEFDPVINRWACQLDEENVYFPAVQCEETTTNRPKIRAGEQRAAWVDNCDNAYVFLFDTLITKSKLWRINTDTMSYTLINSYDSNSFGQQGVLDVNTHPNLSTGASAWTADHAFWYKGAPPPLTSPPSPNSVLWKYVPDSVHANFSYSANATTCEMDFVDESNTGCNVIKSRLWEFGDGTTSTEINPSHYYQTVGDYQVTLIVENCSWDVDTFTMMITAEHACPIELDIQYEDTLCNGECLFVHYQTSQNMEQLLVNNVAVEQLDSIEICVQQATEYIITAVGENGTSDQDTLELTIHDTPEVVIESEGILCPPESITLSAATSADSLSYLWSDGSSSNTLNVFEAGSYWVTVENDQCSSSDTISVDYVCNVVLEMPNVFTPFNNDQVNDYFLPVESSAIVDYHLTILNRWGDVVFETNDLSDGWDGTHQGKNCQAGTYFWVVEYTGVEQESEVIHGNLTLIH